MTSSTRLTAALCGVALATGAFTVSTAAPASATAETCSSYLTSIDQLAAFTGGTVCTATEIASGVVGDEAAETVCGVAMAVATVLSGLTSDEIAEACSLAVQP
jgi:tellurite resistance protein